MNVVEEVKLHIDALANVVEQDPTFFASITYYVKQLKELIKAPRESVSQAEFKLLTQKIEEFYAKWRQSDYPESGVVYIPPHQTSDSDSTVKEINTLVAKLMDLDEDSFKALFHEKPIPCSDISVSDKQTVSNPCIFIGHGRSKLWSRLNMYLENELCLETVAYESESRVGEFIVQILEKMLDQATFAVLVLTAEDEMAGGSRRARQNVIHEAGLFQGRLGFKRAVILKHDGLEDFTNVEGLQYIGFSEDKIEQTFYELEKVLKREGMLQ